MMMTSAFKPASASTDTRAVSAVRVGAAPRGASLFQGNGEPSLDDVMGDPMIRGLMARDGVEEMALRAMLNRVRARLIPA